MVAALAAGAHPEGGYRRVEALRHARTSGRLGRRSLARHRRNKIELGVEIHLIGKAGALAVERLSPAYFNGPSGSFRASAARQRR